eukprot:TRINITY_DN12722_c0_g2_i2.p1 TRINITY_DN12722_c0_g2~~TRINITY_DN12722_c0_g2_i2.p1  ORF type:complete len:559 (+),score=66.14 TRINITY_DN12722_c0_g2_i2:95-1771(+)
MVQFPIDTRAIAADSIMLCVVLCNLMVAVYETDFRSSHDGADLPPWIFIVNTSFLAVYVVELAFRGNSQRRAFFQESSNVFDLLVVCSEIVLAYVLVNLSIPSTLPLRVVRFFRLVRVVKALKQFRELQVMTHGLSCSFRAIFWASCLLFFALLFSSIAAVELIHPINKLVAADGVYSDCSRCPRAFESVFASLLTFTTQIIAGDSWGAVSVPIIEKRPSTAILFLCILLVNHLWVLNLILSVIVDSAHEARDADEKQKVVDKKLAFIAAKRRLERLCHDMDTNLNGVLSLDEVVQSYDTNAEFRDMMRLMDVKREEMPLIFAMMDTDKSGDISSAEFVEQLHRIKSQDLHTMLVFMRYYISSLSEFVRESFNSINSELGEMKSQQIVFAKDRLGTPNGSLEERTEQDSVNLLEELSSQCGQHRIASIFPGRTHLAPIQVETSRLQKTMVDVPHEDSAEVVPNQETSPVMGRPSSAFSATGIVSGAITDNSPAESVKESSWRVLQNGVIHLTGTSERNGNLLPSHTHHFSSQAAGLQGQVPRADENRSHLQLHSSGIR